MSNSIYIGIIGPIPRLDNTDPNNPIVTYLPGWHINSSEQIPGWIPLIPARPYRGILGVPTYYYRFDSEADAIAAIEDAGLQDCLEHA